METLLHCDGLLGLISNLNHDFSQTASFFEYLR